MPDNLGSGRRKAHEVHRWKIRYFEVQIVICWLPNFTPLCAHAQMEANVTVFAPD
jgi:hypothetical protein